MNLTDFLLARIAEDEVTARVAARGGSGQWGSWNRSWDVEPYRDLADESAGERIARLHADLDEHIARHDPARVLAECEAKRRIMELHGSTQAAYIGDEPRISCDECGSPLDSPEPWPCTTLRLLTLPYADHPDYDEAWRP